MREEVLYYLWKFKKFNWRDLHTSSGQPIQIISSGQQNFDQGPDFFNAKLRIAEQLWVGNVEMHLKSSDWFAHQHHQDARYDNVILHVVWQHDAEVYRRDGSLIPVLVLSEFVSQQALTKYQNWFTNESTKWIACESHLATIKDIVLQNWKERLFVERLENRSMWVRQLLHIYKKDWEAVLFCALAKAFGLKVNGEAFLQMATSLPYAMVRKVASNSFQLEALFLGQAGLLKDTCKTSYYRKLQAEYRFLQQKFRLFPMSPTVPKFGRLRPSNFPTIRLAQLTALYHQRPALFSQLMNIQHLSELNSVLTIEVSAFWKNHYTFQKTSAPSEKRLTSNFKKLLILNAILPVKFVYLQSLGKSADTEVFQIAEKLSPERNSIIKKFKERTLTAKNALDSQALLQLKNNYCEHQRCLHCALGATILGRN